MTKILALDPGDKWVGTAISDALKILAKPYKTFTLENLEKDLKKTFKEEDISEIIVGYPKTMSGTESEQTKKVKVLFEYLKTEFPDKKFILWDERLSSKRAEQFSHARTKEEKIKSHSLAAAFILDGYLSSLCF